MTQTPPAQRARLTIGINRSLDDAEVQEAIALLDPHLEVNLAQLYTFSELPPIVLMVDVALQAIRDISVAGVGAALGKALWKMLQSQDRRPSSAVEIKVRDGRQVVAHLVVTTDSETALAEACTTFGAVVGEKLEKDPGRTYRFNPDPQAWEEIDR